MYSSRKNVEERFLQDLANLKTWQAGAINYAGARKLARKYPRMFPKEFLESSALVLLGDEQHQQDERNDILVEPRTPAEREENSLAHLFGLSQQLRQAWKATAAERSQIVAKLREQYRKAITVAAAPFQNDLADTDFERALNYFERIAQFIKYCVNPACRHAYFISVRRTTKTCSEKCSDELQRKFKRVWWAEHGPRWRKARSTQKRRKHAKRHHRKNR